MLFSILNGAECIVKVIFKVKRFNMENVYIKNIYDVMYDLLL